MIGNGDELNNANLGMNTFSNNKGSDKFLFLKRILHKPCITKNLLCVSQFTKDNSVYVEFYLEYFYMNEKISG